MSGLGTTIESGGIVGATAQPISTDVQTIPTNPSEIAHTTSIEGLEFLLNKDFIFKERFTIDVSMQPGTVFGVIRIHPTDAHVYIKHVYEMFNAWNGSFGLRSRFMGTAFYGGSFRVGFLPPNISLNQIQSMSVSALTAYPNVDLDPKNTDWMYYSPPDERNVLFHWAEEPVSSIPSSFGGYVVFYVVGPLVTQNDNFRSISMIVEMQGKFVFAQPNPRFGPGYVPEIQGPLDLISTTDILSQIGCDDRTNSNMAIQVHQFPVQSIPNGGLLSFGFNAKNPGEFQNSSMSSIVREYRSQIFDLMASGKRPIVSSVPSKVTYLGSPTFAASPNYTQYVYRLAHNSETQAYALTQNIYSLVGDTPVIVWEPSSKGFDTVLNNTVFGASFKKLGADPTGHSDHLVQACIANGANENPIAVEKLAFENEPTKFSPMPAGESIVSFVNLNSRSLNIQTYPMARNLRDSRRLDESTSYLYMLRVKGVPTPIRLLRLSANGMWTTTSTTTDVILQPQGETYLTFEQELPYTSPLPPQTSEMYAGEKRILREKKSMDKAINQYGTAAVYTRT